MRYTPLVLLLLSLVLFLLLSAHQLTLPGLHYDEAREAGVNAMQLATGQPVTAFRDATMRIGRWELPLMVQDYIGALNVVLATPFLAIGGIDVVSLRVLPILIGAITLVIAWWLAYLLGGGAAAALTALLLAVSPSFVFWSRQGIFVTNITALFLTASLLSGLLWWRERRAPYLWLTALFFGLGIYAKLLFAWAVVAMIVLVIALSIAERLRQPALAGGLGGLNWSRILLTTAVTVLCLVLPLLPLLVFNLRTGGTVASVIGNLGSSYYGVDNTAYLPNLAYRWRQLGTVLRSDHFWYLGELFRNPLAPFLAMALVAGAFVVQVAAGSKGKTSESRRDQRAGLAFLVPVALVVLIVTQSAFTVSDLFVTHYSLVVPLLALSGGLAAGRLLREGNWAWRPGLRHLSKPSPQQRRGIAVALAGLLAVLVWAAGDLWTTVRYHQVLGVSGGYSAHSDAIYALSEFMDQQGYAQAVALDWGISAPIRYLTQDRVSPTELFGYTSMEEPDSGFSDRMAPFLADPGTGYLAHTPEATVFKGRVAALEGLAESQGRMLKEVARFSERSGRPLLFVYQALPPEGG